MSPDLLFAHSVVLIKGGDALDKMFGIDFGIFGFDRSDGRLLSRHCGGLGLAEC